MHCVPDAADRAVLHALAAAIAIGPGSGAPRGARPGARGLVPNLAWPSPIVGRPPLGRHGGRRTTPPTEPIEALGKPMSGVNVFFDFAGFQAYKDPRSGLGGGSDWPPTRALCVPGTGQSVREWARVVSRGHYPS